MHQGEGHLKRERIHPQFYMPYVYTLLGRAPNVVSRKAVSPLLLTKEEPCQSHKCNHWCQTQQGRYPHQGIEAKSEVLRKRNYIKGGIRINALSHNPHNHNYNKIVKSDWLSTALISALIGVRLIVAGPKSRSRVHCRGRGSNVAVGENDLGFEVTAE